MNQRGKVEKNPLDDYEGFVLIIVSILVAVLCLVIYVFSPSIDSRVDSVPYIEFKVVSLDVVPNRITLALNLNLTLLLTTCTPTLFKPLTVSLEYQNETLPVSRFDELFYPTGGSIAMLPLEMHVTASQMRSDNFYLISNDLGVKQFLEFDVIIQSKYWLLKRSNDKHGKNFKCKVVVDKLPDELSYTLRSGLITCNSSST